MQIDLNKLKNNPDMVTQWLSTMNVQYPINKDNLVQRVQAAGADNQIVSRLKQLPNKMYESASDIAEAIAKIR